MRIRQPRTDGTLGGLPLGRALLVATVAAGVLPLMVVTTALTGLRTVEGAHENAHRVLIAQQYQQDANLMYATIQGDVLGSLEDVESSNESGAELSARTRTHVARLEDDLLQLKAALPTSLASAMPPLDTALRAYGAEAVRLVDLARVSPSQARAQHSAFDSTFDELEQRQTDLTAALAVHATMANDSAERRQAEALRWTSIVAAATLSGLVLLAFGLRRLGTGNEALLRHVREKVDQLASSNDELEEAQQLAHIGSWGWDVGSGQTQCSAEFYRILGVDPATQGGDLELFYARVHPEDAAGVARAQEEAVNSQGDIFTEYRIVRPDGTVRDVRAAGRAVRDDSGNIVRLVGTMQDVTDQRAVQRMKDEFIGVISHELRTPLTSIQGALGLMAGGAVGTLPVKAQRMADVAVNSCQRLVRLVNDVLDVQKMSVGKLELDLAPLPVADLIGDAIEEMRPIALQAGVALTVTPTDAVVLADRDRVAQTLTNLLSNAVNFSPEGGTVSVSAGPAPDETGDNGLVIFTVTDQGAGIPADKLESIFDRFAQADVSDTRAKGGTGLGLPICRGIVEQHGGRIWATSTPGTGSTFTFILRAAPPQALAKTAGAMPIGAALICDDDPDVVEVLAAKP